MTYRERRERKAERLREWADKREAKAEAKLGTARQIADGIPFGQPILVGHHSERRARRDQDRIERNMRGGVEDGRKAEEFRSRADNIEAAAGRAIYSDDDDAAEKLRQRIAELEASRERIKAYNASARKGAPELGLLAKEEKRELARCASAGAAFMGERGQFPKFVLANLSGNLSRNRKRLAQMERGQ